MKLFFLPDVPFSRPASLILLQQRKALPCAYREERQCTARADAVHCGSGCSALQGRLQCTASETGKWGTEITSPILDKRKGR